MIADIYSQILNSKINIGFDITFCNIIQFFYVYSLYYTRLHSIQHYICENNPIHFTEKFYKTTI